MKTATVFPNEEFQLNYIVDFTEADFAQRLVDQINGEIPQTSIITEERLAQVAQKLGMSADDLFDELYDKRYIDRHNNIVNTPAFRIERVRHLLYWHPSQRHRTANSAD